MSALLTCNGHAVDTIRLVLPQTGAWVATLEALSDEKLTGTVTLTDQVATYTGTVLRSGVRSGVCRMDVVGGKGGLSNEVPARSYVGIKARNVAAELLAAVGEALDASSTPSVLGTSLPFWTRASGRAGTALATLVDALGASWRVLQSGAVWIGAETWPTATKTLEALELDDDEAAGNVLLAPDSLALRPGVVLAGRKVGRVEHRISRGALRTTFWVAE